MVCFLRQSSVGVIDDRYADRWSVFGQVVIMICYKCYDTGVIIVIVRKPAKLFDCQYLVRRNQTKPIPLCHCMIRWCSGLFQWNDSYKNPPKWSFCEVQNDALPNYQHPMDKKWTLIFKWHQPKWWCIMMMWRRQRGNATILWHHRDTANNFWTCKGSMGMLHDYSPKMLPKYEGPMIWRYGWCYKTPPHLHVTETLG